MPPIPDTSAWFINLPKGTVVANEYAYVVKNRNYRADGTVPGFLWCGGYTAGATGTAYMGILWELARRGYPIVAGDYGDTPTTFSSFDGPGSWGSPSARTKMSTYKTYLQTVLGAKPGPIGLLYGSHGGSSSYSWARANLADTFCIAGGIGAVDLQSIWTLNFNNSRTSIENAYGGYAAFQAARPMHSGVEVAAAISAAGIPQLDYYSTNDPLCTLATHQALHAAAGDMMTPVSMGAIGHTLNGLGNAGMPAGNYLVDAFCDWVEDKIPA